KSITQESINNEMKKIKEKIQDTISQILHKKYFSTKKLSSLYLSLVKKVIFLLDKLGAEFNQTQDVDKRKLLMNKFQDNIYIIFEALENAIHYDPLNHEAQKIFFAMKGIYVNNSPEEKIYLEKILTQAEYLRKELKEDNYFQLTLMKKQEIFTEIINAHKEDFADADTTVKFLLEVLNKKIFLKDKKLFIFRKDDIFIFLHVLFNSKIIYSRELIKYANSSGKDEVKHPNSLFKSGEGVCSEWSYAFYYIIKELNSKADLKLKCELIVGQREGMFGHMFCIFENKGIWREFQESGISNEYYVSSDKAKEVIKIMSGFSKIYILNKLEKNTEQANLKDNKNQSGEINIFYDDQGNKLLFSLFKI
ncbi:MAG: hypothetical protein KKA19_05980, partial [Candidatus Margulisbacteria bacterium]|nr:hypothetical protein [Candidatus Margulisiibacteriota bacterium]